VAYDDARRDLASWRADFPDDPFKAAARVDALSA
jgi:hypothetical protein